MLVLCTLEIRNSAFNLNQIHEFVEEWSHKSKHDILFDLVWQYQLSNI